MLKWALRIGTFLLSLILGCGASFVRNAPRPISLCQIDDNPAKYVGKIVRIRAIVVNHDGQVTALGRCRGEVRWAVVDLDPQQLSLFSENRRGRIHRARTIIVGRLELPSNSAYYPGQPDYKISGATIELVGSRNDFETRSCF